MPFQVGCKNWQTLVCYKFREAPRDSGLRGETPRDSGLRGETPRDSGLRGGNPIFLKKMSFPPSNSPLPEKTKTVTFNSNSYISRKNKSSVIARTKPLRAEDAAISPLKAVLILSSRFNAKIATSTLKAIPPTKTNHKSCKSIFLAFWRICRLLSEGKTRFCNFSSRLAGG